MSKRFRRWLPPAWPTRVGRARVLVEDRDGGQAAAAEWCLRRAGFEVATCPGPEELPGGHCRLVTEGSCALVAGADVVYSNLGVRRSDCRQVLAAQRSRYPTKRVVVEMSEPDMVAAGKALEGCIRLTMPATSRRLVAAVTTALLDTETAASR
ncbi:MAG: hypothetical protein ACYDB7_15335 [Mycobacteriales bacterium]